MKQILDKVNEIAEVLNSKHGVPNMEWVKNNVNELQKVVKEICNLPVVNVRYCWLRPDGEYSEHKYRNLEEIDDFEKDEANDNGWKLIKFEDVDF